MSVEPPWSGRRGRVGRGHRGGVRVRPSFRSRGAGRRSRLGAAARPHRRLARMGDHVERGRLRVPALGGRAVRGLHTFGVDLERAGGLLRRAGTRRAAGLAARGAGGLPVAHERRRLAGERSPRVRPGGRARRRAARSGAVRQRGPVPAARGHAAARRGGRPPRRRALPAARRRRAGGGGAGVRGAAAGRLRQVPRRHAEPGAAGRPHPGRRHRGPGCAGIPQPDRLGRADRARRGHPHRHARRRQPVLARAGRGPPRPASAHRLGDEPLHAGAGQLRRVARLGAERLADAGRASGGEGGCACRQRATPCSSSAASTGSGEPTASPRSRCIGRSSAPRSSSATTACGPRPTSAWSCSRHPDYPCRATPNPRPTTPRLS